MRLLGLVMAASTLVGGAFGMVPVRAAAFAAPGVGAGAPLDLAAMLLTPADVAAEGWDDFVTPIDDGETLTLDGLAAEMVRSRDRQPAARDALAAAGWRRGDRSQTMEYWDSDAPTLAPIVVASVSAYADAAGAARGLALEPLASNDVDGEVVAVEELGDVPPVGERSRALRLLAEDNTGDPYRVVAVWFRTENPVAGVTVTDWTTAGPSGAGVAALARRLGDRSDRVRREGGPGLSGLATRVAPAAVSFAYGFYQRLDGEEVRSGFIEAPMGLAARAHLGADATDVYRSGAYLAADDPLRALGYTADLYRFATPERASAWPREAPARLRRDPRVEVFAQDDGPSDGGEEAVAVAVTHAGDGELAFHTAAVFVRVGATVAEVGWRRVDAPVPVAAVAAATAVQAACLHDGGPCPPVTVPRELGPDGG